eukprot:TRINITY_DN5898_c0_g1_i1.p2 TRINITY_DN5898_c0_g1~~TRINITY_DN5898_c0_g1_i1.p2  ORF type:complete len:296 (-),score=52.62 TRINITY_DN5898_c0_g1_i1:84-938(-)
MGDSTLPLQRTYKRRRVGDSAGDGTPTPRAASPAPAQSSPTEPRRQGKGSSGEPAAGGGAAAARPARRGSGQQLFLDFGQKEVGTTVCRVCRMVYSRGQADDAAAHEQFHERHERGVRFAGWASERVVAVPPAAPAQTRISVFRGAETERPKIAEVLAFVDDQLGLAAGPRAQAAVYLCIQGGRVVGCAVAEAVAQGFPTVRGSSGLAYSQTEAREALCGISRLWVLGSARRRGVATALAEAVRRTFFGGGFVVPLPKLAFSHPTEAGAHFAEAYVGPGFLVYS